MNNYEIRRHGNKWKVFEVQTNQYIYQANSRWRAVEVKKSLDNGGGFDGQTPHFFKI